MTSGQLLIIGDFNIHMNSESRESKQFTSLLHTYNLTQHVTSPTYRRGRVLDLVITRTDARTISDISVTDPMISDHSAVMITLPTSRSPRPKKLVKFRIFKRLDKDAFKADLRTSLSFSSSLQSPDEILHHFNTVITQLLDKHAPWKHCSLTIRPFALWHTDEIHQLRTEKCKPERTMNRTGIVVHQDISKETRNKLTNAIIKSKRNYIQNKITSASQCQKSLFQCMDELLNKTTKSPLPSNIPVTEQPEALSNFFVEKVRRIQRGFPSDDDQETRVQAEDNVTLDQSLSWFKTHNRG